MSSFTFSDCPTTVALADAERDGKKVSTGSLSLTVRNVTNRSVTGTLSVEPDDMAQSGWFKIAGAALTSLTERDIDCEADATQTVQVDIAVPEGAPAGHKVFSLRVATEHDPDNDFTDSPAVAFEVKALAPKVVPKKPFPWWVAAVAVVAFAIVGGVFWALRPSAPPPPSLPPAPTPTVAPSPPPPAPTPTVAPSPPPPAPTPTVAPSPPPPAPTPTVAPSPTPPSAAKPVGASLVCPQGQTQYSRLCYQACPAGWDQDGDTRCVQQCPTSWQGRSTSQYCLPVTTDDTANAVPASCAAGQTLDNNQCFTMPGGYRVTSPGSIGKICPAGWADDGTNCSLGADTYENRSYRSQMECMTQNSGNKCESLSKGPSLGAPLLYPNCKPGYNKVSPTTCQRPPQQSSKDVHPHGGTPPDQCSGVQDVIEGTCYPRCASGFKRTDKGICSAVCPAGFSDSGVAGCQRPTQFQFLTGNFLLVVGVCPAATPVRTGDLCYPK